MESREIFSPCWVFCAVIFLSWGVLFSGTIATFCDPAADGDTPLFTIDLVGDTISGGWQDGLILDVAFSGNIYENVLLSMTDVSYSGDINGGVTGEGTIRFFEEGVDPQLSEPLIRIDFDSAYVSYISFGGINHPLFGTDGVVITGSEIGGVLTEETSFSFGFANIEAIDGCDGFTATAAFTSSALPEPASVALLAVGGLIVWRKIRRR